MIHLFDIKTTNTPRTLLTTMGKEKFGRITVCQAKPVAYIDRSGVIRPQDAPDLEWEKDLLTDAVQEVIDRSDNDIELDFSGCSMSDMSYILRYGQNSVVQISAHGGFNKKYGSFACFESEQGDGIRHHVFGSDMTKLFQNHKGMVKVVFLSMCDSEDMGREILAAGVPHVLCCKKNNNLNDKAVVEFARNFYHGLACGYSLLKSFNAAREVNFQYISKSELKKIILLPDPKEKGEDYHNVDIFFQKSSIKRPKIDSLKLPYEPPDIFWGRQEEMVKAFKIRTTRFVQITGPRGIGKSSFAKAVCKYIYERPRQFLIKPIIWLDDRQNGAQYNGTPYSEFPKLFQVVTENAAEYALVEYCNKVSKALDKQRALLVIDARNLNLDAIKKLEQIVGNIFEQTKDVKVMTICPPSKLLVLEQVQNYENVVLPPLDLKHSARLFTRIISKTRASELEMRKGWGIIVQDIDPQGEREFMSERSKKIWCTVGNGIPVDIHKKARSIKKEEFQALITIEEKPEVSRRIDTRHHLELEIGKIEEDKNTCAVEGQFLKATDLAELLEELKKFREKLPYQSDLEKKYNEFYESDQYAEAAEIKARIKKEMDVNRAMVVTENPNQPGDEKDREIKMLKMEIKRLKKIIKSHSSGGSKQFTTPDMLTNPSERTKNDPASSNNSSFSLKISRGASIVDFSYESSKSVGIVCATNESCHPLCGGVNMAVETAGGNELKNDVSKITGVKTEWGTARCSTGDAVIIGSDTKSYGSIKAPYIIFAVGPTYYNRESESEGEKLRKDEKLRGAYYASLERAKEHKLEAVGFSLISAGNRSGGDLNRTLRIAVEAIKNFKGYKELKQITICAFSKVECDILEQVMEELDVFEDVA